MSRPYPHHILWHWIAFSPLWLNSHWKLVLNAYTCVSIPRIAKFGQSNHQIEITAGSTLKIGAECIYICISSLNCQIWLVQSPNWHHSWFRIENWCWMDIHMYQFPKLSNLVSPIVKLTSWLPAIARISKIGLQQQLHFSKIKLPAIARISKISLQQQLHFSKIKLPAFARISKIGLQQQLHFSKIKLPAIARISKISVQLTAAF